MDSPNFKSCWTLPFSQPHLPFCNPLNRVNRNPHRRLFGEKWASNLLSLQKLQQFLAAFVTTDVLIESAAVLKLNIDPLGRC